MTAEILKQRPGIGIPGLALWDGVLAAGGPAAALDLLDRITAGQDWQQPPARPTATGSSWDAAPGPDATDPRHLAEWIEGSATSTELPAYTLMVRLSPAAFEALQAQAAEADVPLGLVARALIESALRSSP